MLNKKNYLKKLIALSICLSMILGPCLPLPALVSADNVVALASEPQQDASVPEGYTGIYTIYDLYNIRSNPSGNYILMNDIDLSETAQGQAWDSGNGWLPIDSFSGILDGNGYSIKNMHLYGNLRNGGFINENKGTVMNIRFDDVDVDISDTEYYGTICAMYSSGTITHCGVTGSIKVKGRNTNVLIYIGGLVGNSFENCISYSWNAAHIDTEDTYNVVSMSHSNCFTGGITGYISNSADYYIYSIEECYNSGKISGNGIRGGITGCVNGKCYQTKCCNFEDGGLNGNDSKKVYNMYAWYLYPFTFGYTGHIVHEVKGLYTESFKDQANFTNLDFSESGEWEMAPDGSRPQLKNPREITVTEMEITRMPPKTSYYAGDEIVAMGEVSVVCSNGNTGKATITKDMLSGYDMNKVGKQTVTVSYMGGTAYFDITVNPVKATGISLNKTTLKMNKGQTDSTLEATITPANVTDKTVKWRSSNTNIATIDENGVIRAVDKGTVNITAETENGKTAVCVVTISNPAQSIALEDISLHVGGSKTLAPTINPADTTSTLSWSSSNTSVATVDNAGKVTAVAPGVAQIRVDTSDGPYAVCTVDVDAPARTITLSKKSKVMVDGEDVVLDVTIDPDNTTDIITCYSSDDNVAEATLIYENERVFDASTQSMVTVPKVTGVQISAKKKGTAVVTVQSSNGKNAVCNVTVKQSISSLNMPETDIRLKIGKLADITLEVTPEQHDDKITWTSSDPETVSVTATGRVKALQRGSATITATTQRGITASCTVTAYEIKVQSRKAPTCTESGNKKYYYQLSDTIIGYFEDAACTQEISLNDTVLEALGHKYVESTIPATCTEEGYVVCKCSRCGDDYISSEIPALGHDYGQKTVAKKATPSAVGKEEEICERCGLLKESTIARPSTMTLSETSYYADGTVKKPAVTVKDTSGNVISPVNYSVTYSNNVNAGTAKVVVTFKGERYEGTLNKTFTIKTLTELSGKCGEYTTYKLNLTTGIMTISGYGDMEDYKYSTRTPWFKYRDKIKKVTIGSDVTRIGTNTFYGCTNLTEVTGCLNVESIGINTFRNCPVLTKVAGCSYVTLVEQYAFCGSNKFATIGSTAGTVNLPLCTKIGGYTFYECKGIKKLVTSTEMAYIGTRSFSNCTALTAVTVGSSCKTIGSYAFCGNTSLTTVNGCAGLTGIGDFAFYNNGKLTSVAGCTKVVNIGKSIFRNCTTLTKVGATAGQINFAAAKSVGEYAFSGCKAAIYISLGTNLTTIGQYAFQNDSALSSLYIRSSNLTSVGGNAFKGIKSTAVIYVPYAKVSTYKNGVFKGKGQGNGVSYKAIPGTQPSTPSTPTLTQAQKNFNKVKDYLLKNGTYNSTTGDYIISKMYVTSSGNAMAMCTYSPKDNDIVVGYTITTCDAYSMIIIIPYKDLSDTSFAITSDTISEILVYGYINLSNSEFSIIDYYEYGGTYSSASNLVKKSYNLLITTCGPLMTENGLSLSYLGFK